MAGKMLNAEYSMPASNIMRKTPEINLLMLLPH